MADPPPLDVAGIVRQAEARAAEGRAEGRYGEDPALVPLPDEAAWERLEALAVLRGSRPPGVHRRAAVRLAAPFVDDLVEQANRFHAAVVEAVRSLEGQLAAERARGDRLEAELERLRGGGGVRPLRIAWDVSPLSVPPTGIGTYIREALLGAARVRPEHRFVALSLGGRNETVRLAAHLEGLPAGIERRHLRLRGAAVWRRVANTAPVPLLERLTGPVDAFVGSEWLYPRQRRGVRIAVVHDLIPLRFPEWTTPATRRMHLRKLHDVRRADAVVANSAATARDVTERLGVPAERIHVARPGVDDVFRTARPAATGPAGERPYLLAVGTLEPRKNLATLLDAYAVVRRERPELALVLVGAAGWGEDTVAERIGALGLEGDVVRTGYLPHAELPPIMAGARAFCWPTLFEGFGMPVAEALAAGVPVVCSDDPSLDEAAGDAAWRAPARDAEAVAAAIVDAVGDEAERERRVALGRAHAAALTWEACGTVYVEVVERLAAARA